MAGTAEILSFTTYNAAPLVAAPSLHAVAPFIDVAPPGLNEPKMSAIPEMASDQLTRYRSARFIGQVMTSQAFAKPEVPVIENPIDSLHDALPLAAQGDHAAIQLIDMSVKTDMIERTLKVGHVMEPVPIKVLPGSRTAQYNQTGDMIQANSLVIAGNDEELGPRTKAETNNHFRTQDLHRAEWFEENSLLVLSLAGKNPELFFTETMSAALQLTSKDGDNLQLESAFVAGIAELGGKCRDIDIVIAFGEIVGIDLSGLTPAELIDKPIGVPNKMIPNGVIDLVKLWDEAAEKVYGRPVFFGEFKTPPCSYEDYLKLCHERTKTFETRKVAARNQLITESGSIKTRLQAIERLHELSEAQMVEKAVEDHSIDPRVFGPKASVAIVEARAAIASGDFIGGQHHTKLAKDNADSKSCPWMRKNKKKLSEVDLELDDISAEIGEAESESDEDCDFESKECPECGAKNVWTRVESLGNGKKRISGSCGCSKIV